MKNRFIQHTCIYTTGSY